MGGEMIVLDGLSLTLRDIVRVAREGCGARLSDEAVTAVKEANALVEEWAASDEVVYGITTGFGDLASVKISPRDRRMLQENLLRSHACGVGIPYPVDVTRAIMLLRVNTLSRGHSGISHATLSGLIDLLNAGIHPLIPCQGSVGASGDLCPLSHLAIALLGDGEAEYKGRIVPVRKALAAAGLKPLSLGAKEGLALNNGTTVMNAVGALALVDALRLAKTADIVAAMSMEGLHGVPWAYDARTHELRAYRGQNDVASNIRRLIEDSEIVERHKRDRVQDAYSLRCVPQVHGASRDALSYIRSVIEVEINSVTDNPLIFPKDREVLSGGNFHGQPLALAMDFFGIAMAEFADISERRQARMVDASLSGLPPFLIEGSGLNSGFMIPQYTSAALVSENKVLAHPSSVDSIPTSANQEDHVSMGGYAARKAVNILENVRKVLAIEMLLAAQALDFSRLSMKPGRGTLAAHECVRGAIPYIRKDEYLHPLIERVLELTERGSVIDAVEAEIGELA
ncbi:MAG: histidine ammonia-lyase [Synergistaceae bacterium]|jgi:histidine ammonia-lyase|nr:histidine ammonia-lyase [Synergistaceae bacterium]